jgi:hypothetical protein
MPVTDFDTLPDDARLWVFGAAADVDDIDAPKLLTAVDLFLEQWAAHGHPLTSARTWRDDRFLVVAVDQRTEGASGCSIDGLFRLLQGLEKAIGTTMVGGGLVYFRDSVGLVHSLSRTDFEYLAKTGGVNGDTPVFDTAVVTAGAYRSGFEKPARDSWQARLLPREIF